MLRLVVHQAPCNCFSFGSSQLHWIVLDRVVIFTSIDFFPIINNGTLQISFFPTDFIYFLLLNQSIILIVAFSHHMGYINVDACAIEIIKYRTLATKVHTVRFDSALCRIPSPLVPSVLEYETNCF